MTKKFDIVERLLETKLKATGCSFNEDIISPFEENEGTKMAAGEERLTAHQLFGIFTANIIKENTRFIR